MPIFILAGHWSMTYSGFNIMEQKLMHLAADFLHSACWQET